jgi:hypothetical protein
MGKQEIRIQAKPKLSLKKGKKDEEIPCLNRSLLD